MPEPEHEDKKNAGDSSEEEKVGIFREVDGEAQSENKKVVRLLDKVPYKVKLVLFLFWFCFVWLELSCASVEISFGFPLLFFFI